MKIFLILLLVIVVAVFKINELKNVRYIQPEILSNKKILTVYYSNCGNTKNVAQNLHSIVGGDIKEIQLKEKYPNNIFEMSKLVRNQMKEGYLPKIDEIDVSNYDIIFVGSPVWNFSVSLPVKSFLKNNNFENKTLIPFITCSGGVLKSKVHEEIKNLANAKTIKKPLLMFENGIFLVKEQIVKWLNNI
ncbi:hypothetical protein IJ670_02505 [bacterium]|nr:hypothetical protein [bacterium]